MDLNDLRIDVSRQEDGGWVDNIPEMGDLRLRVRGLNNASWRKLQATLYNAVPRNKRPGGQVDPDEQDRITGICLRDTCLLDWDGVTQNGEPVAYSRELANKLLTDPQFRKFREAVIWAAMTVAEQDAADAEDARKN